MEKMKYEEMMGQLEDIVKRLENNEMGIDEMGEQLKKAQELIKLCKDRLVETEKECAALNVNTKL